MVTNSSCRCHGDETYTWTDCGYIFFDIWMVLAETVIRVKQLKCTRVNKAAYNHSFELLWRLLSLYGTQSDLWILIPSQHAHNNVTVSSVNAMAITANKLNVPLHPRNSPSMPGLQSHSSWLRWSAQTRTFLLLQRDPYTYLLPGGS